MVPASDARTRFTPPSACRTPAQAGLLISKAYRQALSCDLQAIPVLVHQVWARLLLGNSSSIECAGSVPLQRLDATHSRLTARLSQILLLPRNLATSGRLRGTAPSRLGGGARRSGPSLRVQVMRGLVNLMDQLSAADKHRSQGPVLLEVSGVVLQHIASVARCAHFVKHHQACDVQHTKCHLPL